MRSFLGHALWSTDDGRLFAEDMLQVVEELCQARSIPRPRPVSQIWMIHSAVYSHMLTGPDRHVSARRDIDMGGVVRIGVRHPYLQRKVVWGASKEHGQRASQRQEQGGRAVLVGVDFGARGEGRIQRESPGGVGVGALGVVVFLADSIRSDQISSVQREPTPTHMQHAVQPGQHLVRNRRRCRRRRR